MLFIALLIAKVLSTSGVSLDITSEEVQSATTLALKWLNMKVNQIRPYTLKEINSAVKNDSKITLNVILVTEAYRGKDFHFELVIDPSINSPLALIAHKQLN